jgi:hypothetical protein
MHNLAISYAFHLSIQGWLQSISNTNVIQYRAPQITSNVQIKKKHNMDNHQIINEMCNVPLTFFMRENESS